MLLYTVVNSLKYPSLAKSIYDIVAQGGGTCLPYPTKYNRKIFFCVKLGIQTAKLLILLRFIYNNTLSAINLQRIIQKNSIKSGS